ncbi:membrane protein involved in the export of O-antigen and teichoic acid [Rivularia sp. PCC 7116]|uniref:lipopolysaccharide biosynthesis protein n=1 Tax=Rivularia sp. PCC 7116 TaxID=373994 RepID=UPI00029ED906|nr:lipopolysaccharide biosynthesis protein [Rivularia sp. PCC 7116]AFY53085.1 membrane protein involved in the export of O-antigen and teichoic acid [Rivularia sp. PCC 7116]
MSHNTVNNEQYFNTDHLKADLKGRSVRGGAVTIAAQGSRFILQMGSTVFLARLLAPEDFGLIGMVTVIINFAGMFKDLGLSTATIQKAEINHKQVSTLFWINFAISTITAFVVAGLAPVVAWFYKEPRLVWITLALASNFIFGGLTVQHQALLKRQMSFTSLAKVEIISMLLGVVSAVISAWYGLGYWALVLMQIATAIANAVGVWVACSWRPGVPLRGSGIRLMLAFGGNVTGFNLVNYFSRNLDNVLIGQYRGPQELGLYAVAYKLVLLPIQQINTPITSVALPALSSLQNEPQKYSKFYYKAILWISTLGMPMTGFLMASADKVILVLLGKQWLGAVLIFQLLMPAAFNATIGVAMGWVYQSLGKVDRQLRWGIVSSIVNVILFLIGVRWGAIGIAAAYGLSRPIFLVAGFAYCYQGTPLRLIELAKTLLQPALASFGAAVVLIGINKLLPPGINDVIALLLDFVLYCLLYFAIWIVLPNGRSTLFEMLEVIKTFRGKAKRK